ARPSFRSSVLRVGVMPGCYSVTLAVLASPFASKSGQKPGKRPQRHAASALAGLTDRQLCDRAGWQRPNDGLGPQIEQAQHPLFSNAPLERQYRLWRVESDELAFAQRMAVFAQRDCLPR